MSPYAVSVWFRPVDFTNVQCLWNIADKDVDTQRDILYFRADQSPKFVQFLSQDGVNFANADTSTQVTSTAWHHAFAMLPSATDRRVWLDHAGKGTDNTSAAVGNRDRTRIGRRAQLSTGGNFDGRLALCAVWDLTNWPGATASDKGDSFETTALPGLAKGWTPLSFPLGLVAFWPLGGLDTEETDGGTARDIWGGYDMTAVSAATGPGVADHPGGLIYPSTGLVYPAAAAVAAVGNPWYYYANQAAIVG